MACAVPVPDHYRHWNTAGADRGYRLDREQVHLDLLSAALVADASVLDIGCGSGRFLRQLAEQQPRLRALIGVELSEVQVDSAISDGLLVTRGSADGGLPFRDGHFDAVTCAQVIEHVVNPDALVQEAHRVLRPGGVFVLSTPNLCAWFNRALVVAGAQPVFAETSTTTTLVGAGRLGRLKRDPHPVGHLRLFTLRAISDLLHLHGFSVIATKGAVFDEAFPRPVLRVDRAFTRRPSLAALLVVAASRS